jgi:hypothetical protein
VLPAAVWIATSADALFMGVAAWGVALVVLASGRDGIRGDVLAVTGGTVLGAGLFLTYGIAPLLVIPAAIALARRRPRPLVLATAAASAVVVAFAAGGFSWLAGLRATRSQYLEGVAWMRGYWYFLFVNIGVLAIALGPASVAGLGRLRDRGLLVLAGSAVVAVTLADLSGMSKGEVERIWLLFVPWLAVACAGLERRTARAWLAASASTGILVQALIRSPW